MCFFWEIFLLGNLWKEQSYPLYLKDNPIWGIPKYVKTYPDTCHQVVRGPYSCYDKNRLDKPKMAMKRERERTNMNMYLLR